MLLKMNISREKYHFEEITHLVDVAFDSDQKFREIVGTFTGDTVRTTIRHSDRFVVLRAEIDKRLAGTITVRIRPGEYHLMYLTVAQPFRGRGVANGLMEYIFDSFPGRVYRLVCEPVMEFMYRKFGFEEVGKTLSGMIVMERNPERYSIEDIKVCRLVGNQAWEGSHVVLTDSCYKAERVYEHVYSGREVIVNHLRGVSSVLNKASLAALALDFYPESSFHGRYNTIHAVDNHKVIKSISSEDAGVGVGIVQPGAKIYYTAGNSKCISQDFISPHLDKDGYKYDLMTRVYVSAAGVFWLTDIFQRRCLEVFNPGFINFANATRFEDDGWNIVDKTHKMISDMEQVIQTLFSKTFEKLFCGVYSGFQTLDIITMYDVHEKLWLMECHNTVLEDEDLTRRVLNARLRECYEGMTKISI